VQQRTRVFQHDARLGALLHQAWHNLAHTLVTPVEYGGVVVIADIRMLHHVLQIANECSCLQIFATGRDQRLVHVQGIGVGAADVGEIDPALG
jgi:hypothetical protein